MTDKPKILYVDDEPINLQHFAAAFEDDFQVVTVGSGAAAMEIFTRDDSHDIAVVVSDYRMPKMTGSELFARLFVKNPDPTRVILTAYADFDVISQSVNSGHIYQYVQKPWEYDNLKAILCRAAETFAMTKENKQLVLELAQRNRELQTANENLDSELRKNKISEKKRREVELLMLSQAKLASLGQMATGIAHEINQPLTFIKIMMEATKRDFKGNLTDVEEFIEDVEVALVQINRITAIIDHLRTFGRSDSSELRSLPLTEVVDNALIPLRQRLRLENIDLNVQAEPALPPVHGDLIALGQVFINLIANAEDAMAGSDNKKLTIKISRRDEAVLVRVTDSGSGMSPEVMAKIYEPFYTTKEVGKGTGIGLAISYGIIQDHGGSITCRSTPGVGTTFTIALPVQEYTGDFEELGGGG